MYCNQKPITMKTYNVPNMTTQEFIDTKHNGIFKCVGKVTERCELKENEYYITLVTDNRWKNESPHVKAYDWFTQNWIVGIETTSGPNGYYISKDFSKRDNGYRGPTYVVEVLDKSKCREL